MVRRTRPSTLVIGSIVALALPTAMFTIVGAWQWALAVGALYGVGDGILSVLVDSYAIHTSHSHVRAGMVSVSQMARNLGKLTSPILMTAIVAVSSLEIAFVAMGLIGLGIVPLMLPLRRMDADLGGADSEPAPHTAAVDEVDPVAFE